MNDIIRRSALGIGKAKREVFDNPAYADGWNAAIDIITEAPAVDAVPVVHGRWLINPDGYYPYCSECKEEPESGKMTKFCPNCGADMRGGNDG